MCDGIVKSERMGKIEKKYQFTQLHNEIPEKGIFLKERGGSMHFIDKAKIYIEAGKGGDGTVAFRREAHVPKGGPAGGDGGKGGSIIFEATTSLSTLLDLKYKRVYKARPGGNGMAKNAWCRCK